MNRARRWSAAAALLLAAASVLPGCGPRRGGRAEPARADSSFAAVTYRRDKSPEALSLARGRVLYDRYCAICHGEAGGGDGFNAYNVKAAFDVSPTAFTDSVTFGALREDTALAAIRDGGPAVGRSPAMPPWGHTLTAGEVVDVWAYIKALSRAAPGE
ncbi:MAG: cytochrome c [Candidatus Eisenbacteria bacterium]|nr:cytochrome c [Candidatus Eisenbacteria bacterium]